MTHKNKNRFKQKQVIVNFGNSILHNRISIILILLIFFGCRYQKKNYKPIGLNLIDKEELIRKVRKGEFFSEGTIFKDTLGTILSKEFMANLDENEVFVDRYVDNNNKIIEAVVRKMTNKDKILVQEIMNAYNEGEPISTVNINCDSIKVILENVLIKDQDRSEEINQYQNQLDKENQIIVVSIIDKCGFPLKEEVGQKGMMAIFLVLQHSRIKLMEDYLPLLEQSAIRGDMRIQDIALMEDRILTGKGVAQKYGSQVFFNEQTGKYELSNTIELEYVNQRRKTVGLGPIEEYLAQWNIEFNVEQKNKIIN